MTQRRPNSSALATLCATLRAYSAKPRGQRAALYSEILALVFAQKDDIVAEIAGVLLDRTVDPWRCERCAGASASVKTRQRQGYRRRQRKCKLCGHRWYTYEQRRALSTQGAPMAPNQSGESRTNAATAASQRGIRPQTKEV